MTTSRCSAATLCAALVIVVASASNLAASIQFAGDGTSGRPKWIVVGNANISINDGSVTLAGPGIGGVEQNFPTSPGGTYLVGFQLGMTGNDSPVQGELRVSWDGQVLYDGDISSMPLTTFTYEVAGGKSGAANLQFDLVQNRLIGDGTGDGVVDFADLGLVTGNYGSKGTWSQGDFTGDGVVDFADLGIVVGNWGQTLASVKTFNHVSVSNVSVTSSVIVPEPATIIIWSLLGTLAITVSWRRRKAA